MTCSGTSNLITELGGERWNHVLAQGEKWGTFEAEMFNPGPPDGDGLQVDLTGCSIFGDIRRKFNDTASIATISTLILSQSTYKGRYNFGLPSATTKLITAGNLLTDRASRYVWDLWFRDASGEQFRLYYGDFVLSRRVTRANP